MRHLYLLLLVPGMTGMALAQELWETGWRCDWEVDPHVRPWSITEEKPPRRSRPGYVIPGYTIDVKLPRVEGLGTPQGRQAFQDLVLRRAQTLIDDLKSNLLSEREGEPEEEPEPWPHSYLSIDCTVHYLSDDLIGVGFWVEEFGAGAAHPIRWAYTVNFLLREGRELKLGDLFRSRPEGWNDPARFTERFARACAKQICRSLEGWTLQECLAAVRGEDLLMALYKKALEVLSEGKEGGDIPEAKPVPWENFLLERDGLRIVVSSFPHVVGEVQTCLIPYKRLAPALKPEIRALLGLGPG